MFLKSVRHLSVFILLLSISLGLSALSSNKGKPTIIIKYSFINIVDSCNYLNRIVVFIDGEKVAVSIEKKQSEPNSLSFSIKKGKHKIRIMDEVFFQGKWEEHTLANDYNIDALYESEMLVKKNQTINLVFDLDKGVNEVP
jgi:hypothetical protein